MMRPIEIIEESPKGEIKKGSYVQHISYPEVIAIVHDVRSSKFSGTVLPCNIHPHGRYSESLITENFTQFKGKAIMHIENE